MADHTRDKTGNVVRDVKSALRGIKGTGDAIRGTVNESVDTAFDDKHGEVKNRAVKEKGEAEMRQADQTLGNHPTTHRGTTGTTTGTPELKTGGLGGGGGGGKNASSTTTTTHGTTTGTTTGAGVHSGGVGNLNSAVPPHHGNQLGGEPVPTRERY